MTLQKQPDGLDGTTPSEVVPQYLPTGWLKAVSVKMRNQSTPTDFVSSITYNPKGQREQITYGNGTNTVYTYENKTFRLTGMVTTVTASNAVKQDISYLYDPAGNILKITDWSHDKVIIDNVIVDPVCTYEYDSLYRLVSASGRQHNALLANHDVAGAFKQSAHLNNPEDLSLYTQTYQYDDAGNLTRMVNAVPGNSAASYTRYIDVDGDSNRALQRPELGQTDFTGKFDANGNQVGFDHLASVAWDFRNNMARAVVIDRTADVDDAEYYVYDAAGQRVRKVTRKLIVAGTSYDVEDKIYLGNVEVKKVTRMVKVDGVYVPSPDFDMHRTSMHVMDDKNRIAINHFWHVDDDEREVATANLDTNRVRYQYGNHLGSASLELDAAAAVISYEEYFPYGGTSFMYGASQAEVKLKEYRYSAKERDDATAFYYYGARYYAPWLCRWTSPDPAGPVDGPNLFWFVRGNPVGLKDIKGNKGTLPSLSHTSIGEFGPGVLQRAYDENYTAAADSNNSTAERVMHGAAAMLLAVPAEFEELGRFLVNTPNRIVNESRAVGEHAARAILKAKQGDAVGAFNEGGAALESAVLAVVDISTIVVPAKSLASKISSKAVGYTAKTELSASAKETGSIAETKVAGENVVRPGGKAAAGKPVPNPFGSKGGPAHREKILQRIEELKAQGYKLVAGGEKSEATIKTTGGFKNSRRPDIMMTAPDGTDYYENVGRSLRAKDGTITPVSRERKALDDIERVTGIRPVYTPYDR